MSYILNALRKSERERQAIKPDTITNRIILPQPAHHRRSTWLIAALIVMNLAILIYFLGFAGKTPPAGSATVASVKSTELLPPETTEPTGALNKESSTPKIADPAPINAKDAMPVTRTSVKLPLDPKPRIEAAKPSPLNNASEPQKPSHPNDFNSKAVAPVAQTPETPPTGVTQPMEPVKTAVAPSNPDIQNVEPVKYPAQKIAPLPTKSDLPFLDELPTEFQRTLPDLSINVYSYSAATDESFIMIDMVKYLPGQQIKDALDLKEIYSDGFVVSYKGRTFKIRRP